MRDPVPSPHFSGLVVDLSHTLPEVLGHVARTYGDKPFCVSEAGAVTSFRDFERRVMGLGADLLSSGVQPGDRVAIWAPNSPEWMVAACAIQCIGAMMIPINTRFKGPEARYILEKSRACALFTVRSFLGTDYARLLQDACGGPGTDRPVRDLPHLKAVNDLGGGGFAPPRVSAEAEAAYRRAADAVTPETTADILFTSGTTGAPKGAMHSHGQALWMVGLWSGTNDLRSSDRMLVVNPFFHSFGYRSGWVVALAAGMTMYPMAVFDAGAVLRLIERERITVMGGAPTVFFSLLQHPDFAATDISSLRCGQTGGAKTPPEIIRAGYEQLGFDVFQTSYGLTETTALVSANLAGDSLEVMTTTVGRPVAGVEVRLVDPSGADVAPGESGELLVRGPNVMQGYFEDPEQTAATIDPDGWLHTGDVAALDPSGRLRILDRLKDVVIVGGFNAYPVEIEIALGAHPAIAEVAVIGVPDERLGEVCAACVVLKPGETLTLAELAEWSRERMANYKVPRRLVVMDEFPRTPLGKVQKFALRERVRDPAA